MNEILPTYTERQNAARERLRTALGAETNRERYLVDWLIGCFTADEADEWSEMVERAYLRGIDIGNRAAQLADDVDRMSRTELQALLDRCRARVAELKQDDVVAEFDANRAPGTRDAGSGAAAGEYPHHLLDGDTDGGQS